MDKLFVYGTLKPGCSNHHILQNIGGDCIKATLFGFEFDKDWEKQTGYPGLIKSNFDAKVEGFLFVSENLKRNWEVLDGFETEAYTRKIVPITIKNNQKVNGFVYVINTNFDINNF
ncbi:gamma-glutamylcyclotransferase family protein [Polaribacter sp.]|uniref:gamma-glutamylcyclotransferase family protein n=1 Tax=Polaribacter sp. TaxID=1920175 RepID=UPI003F6AE9A9